MVFKFTIDNVLNKYVPANRLNRLPKPVLRFLGCHKTSPAPDYLIWLEILVSSFCGIALLEGIFKSQTVFTHHNVPIIIASYGATAILCFNASLALLAQPRNIFFGHFLSSLIGVCIQKLFLLSQRGRDNYWASGALSVGVSSVLMSITNCVHPPAGASALLPSSDEQIREMSWWYLPAQIISSVLIITVAMITGNILRCYPVYWWTSASLKKEPQGEKEKEEQEIPKENNFSKVTSSSSFVINGDHILIPPSVSLNESEVEWLNILQKKLNTLENPKLENI